MNNKENPTYYNQVLFQHNDQLISSQTFKVEYFFSVDQWGASQPKIKIGIYNFKSKISEQLVLDFQSVFQYLERAKSFNESLRNNLQVLKKETNKQETFFIINKKKFFVTLLYRTEYSGPCFRLIISDKNDNFLDSEKVYITLNDYLSFTKILALFRDSYFSIISNSQTLIFLDELSDKIEILNNKVTAYCSEYFSKNNKIEKIIVSSSEIILPNKLEEVNNFDITNIKDDHLESSSSSEVELEEKNNIQNNLDSYIHKEVPKIELDIPESFKVEKKDNVVVIINKCFTKDLIQNDLTNLESLVINSVNDILPFSKICNYIESKLNFNPVKDFNSVSLNCLNYLISCYLKYQLKLNIEKKQKLPSTISPIIIENITLNDERLSLVYDIFLYMIYLTQIRNSLQDKDFNSIKNKDLFSFSLKMIFSPIVFSYVCKCEVSPLSSEISRRYNEYRKIGVFDLFENQIKREFSFIPNIVTKSIEDEAIRISNSLKQNSTKCNIENTFKKYEDVNVIKLSYNDFYKNSFTIEQIKKIVSLELNYYKNQRVNFDDIQVKDFSDIDQEILKKYGVSEVKYDNSNLKRFIVESCKDNKESLEYCQSLITNIKESYFDLLGQKIDFTKIPEKILKAIYLWDLKIDKKISLNYNYFCELINKTSLERDSIISILTNLDKRKDGDFIDSFQAAREDI